MYRKVILALVICMSMSACNGIIRKIPLPDIKPANELPSFVKQQNEVEIADSMNDIDPTFVLGVIVDTRTGMVRGMDSYLTPEAKPTVAHLNEVVFRDFIENSLAVNVGWLNFLSGQVNESARAEVSVVKNSKATIKNTEINRSRLIHECTAIPSSERANHCVIIGYVDFLLTAGLFKDLGTDSSASGYGAKIGGKWYSKSENISAQHRVIAVVMPLPILLDEIEKKSFMPEDLDKLTQEALREGNLKIDLPKALSIKY